MGQHAQHRVLTCAEEEGCSEFSRLVLYRYDPAADQWTFLSVTDVQLGRPMGGVIGGKLYATGGPSGDLVAYDPATNGWTSKSPLPRPRWSGAGVALDGKLYILGGFQSDPDGTRRLVRKTSVYDPATNTWTTKAVVGGARPGNNLAYTP